MKNRYRIYLINHDYFASVETRELDRAILEAKRIGFQCSILFNGTVVASYCPLAGVNIREPHQTLAT